MYFEYARQETDRLINKKGTKMILDRFKLDGKNALVTGAGRGIGYFLETGPSTCPVARGGLSIRLPLVPPKYSGCKRDL